jgi:nucleoside-diphosphate-sugar epimerase
MILLTGATGFIGSELLKILELRGKTVRPVCRNKSSLTILDNSNWFEIGEIDSKTNWLPVLSGIEVVIHAAGIAHITINNILDLISKYREINCQATINLARQAASVGVKRFIFISSIKVNGEFTEPNHPFRSDDIPNPKDAYGISKLEAEQALQELSAKTGLEIVIIRPPLVYGTNVKGNLLSLVKLIKTGIPIPFGSIKNRRSLVSIANLSDFIFCCLSHPNAAGQVFLVSDGIDLSTIEIIQKIGFDIGVKVKFINIPVNLLRFAALIFDREKSMQKILGSLQVDINKNKILLGWEPISYLKL